ncbi:MAG: alpha/beta hydrolase [Saprospiraceae bacterium]|nr:alpha/beta hydrolase [Saprospiraceae bacterium]
MKIIQFKFSGMYIIHKKSKVAYQQIGKGETLVLLHGFCEDSTLWANFTPVLSKKYHVITIDLSGFGKSDLLEEHSIDAMAEAVYAVLAHLSIKKSVLIGHSMGGYVGLCFAESHPELLSGLGLFHSHPFPDSEQKKADRKRVSEFIKQHGIAPFAGHFVFNLFAKKFVTKRRAFIDRLIHKTSMHHSDAIIAASNAMIKREDKSEVLTKLTCPVLFIVGKQDNAISIDYSLRQLSLPKMASVHIFEDVGHMGMYEIPEKTLEVVEEFMDFCFSFYMV